MAYCLNPNCLKPENFHSGQFCASCGLPFLLKKRYEAGKPLGQGGFGRTFLGRDIHLPNAPSCVIKQLYLQQSPVGTHKKAIQLFEQEAVRLFELGNHPQIPTLFAHFEQNGDLYLIQEWIEGQTLTPHLWQEREDLEARIWELLRGLLPVLQFIHERKVIHRDIKPENIIQRQQDRAFVLIDFGIARVLSQTALMGGATVVGTLGFMAPEQLRGTVLPASDLYSLGVTCIHLLCGTDPEKLFDIVDERWLWRDHLPPGTTISPRLGKILNQLLHPSLRQRSQSAFEVLREMDAMGIPTEEKPSRATTTNSPPPSLTRTPQQSTLFSETTAAPSIQIDYTQLQLLLSKRKWRDADEETWAIVCQLAGKNRGTYIFNSDIQYLPCQDLKTIDRLWFQYSKGKFGFRVQVQIYQEVGEEYHLFCDRVGWTTHQLPFEDKSLKFSLRAPVGHLPSRRWIGGYAWWKHANILMQTFNRCEIF
ncbi:GUN4 domain-containing protein [Lusitaniella coriacea LEGE 07157]|uniref:non-specific serine/threonine protein kinase n=1 Tax=Lusitaniella coriacea LEGE 07157 TaxID=945747 RepID=A0A8J7IU05_9CYAN|nr:serine/threonine-protein kinase [Lusitaniella coriacea]MBE9116188.1 GUN4 domain-containing protein [Lusitaniella coriacea LEGE 07157]